MEELILNLHMHTPYSDGTAYHAELGQIALLSGLDVILVTDHNVFVNGMDGYISNLDRKLLLMVGEEIHDRNRNPQKNHLLVFGADRELTQYAANPQQLIDQVNASGGICFLAHPTDPALPSFNEPDISWVDWSVRNFTGLELWNGFSELKVVAKSKLQVIFYALFPAWLAHRPPLSTVTKWDELTGKGKRVVAIGGSDAHALHMRLGPIRKVIYPYQFHFRAINTHLLTPVGLSGNLAEDRRMVLTSLKNGNCFIGYDLPAPTRGFRFTGHSKDRTLNMGDETTYTGGATFQIRLPDDCECNLLCDGEVLKSWHNQQICSYLASKPGVYRVECYIRFKGKHRAWIFSNPIYLRPPRQYDHQ
jgi:hypothetical protein